MATVNFLGLDSLASLVKSSASVLKKSDTAFNSDPSLYLAQGSAWGDMADPRASYFDDWLQAGTDPTNTLVTPSFTSVSAGSNLSPSLPVRLEPNAYGFVSPSVMLNSVTDYWLPDSSPGKTPAILTNGGPDTPSWQPTGTPKKLTSGEDQPLTQTNISKTEDRHFDFIVSESRLASNSAGNSGLNPLLSPVHLGYDLTTHGQTTNVAGAMTDLAALPN